MARPPKPTQLHILNGTAKRHPERLNKLEPKPPAGVEPPPWFKTATHSRGVAWTTWHRLVAILEQMKIVTVADGESLALGCLALRDYLELPIGTKSGGERSAAALRYMTMLREFGLTPAARSKVKMIEQPPEDPVEAWTKGKAQ